MAKLNADEWFWLVEKTSQEYKSRAISPEGTKPGAVLASPHGHADGHANYRRVWVRDQALVMDSVLAEYSDPATTNARKEELRQQLKDYVEFSFDLQRAVTRSGGVEGGDNLGEALVNPDGSIIHEGWGLPQWDGIAIRSLTLVKLFESAQKLNDWDFFHSVFGPSAAKGGVEVIRTDLDAVSKRWKETSYDIWEEERGYHLDVLGKHAAAMTAGARLGKYLGEEKAAEYGRQAKAILARMEELKFWNGKYFEASRGVEHGLGKYSNLDVAVIFMINHTDGILPGYSATTDKVQATAFALKTAFKRHFAINRSHTEKGAGVLIGRYVEDSWDGKQRGGKGYGWAIATEAMAQFSYRARSDYQKSGKIEVTELNLEYLTDILTSHGEHSLGLRPGETISSVDNSPRFEKIILALQKEGDAYFRRVQIHSHRDGTMNEGINGDSGYMQGPPNLTWGYAQTETARRERYSGR